MIGWWRSKIEPSQVFTFFCWMKGLIAAGGIINLVFLEVMETLHQHFIQWINNDLPLVACILLRSEYTVYTSLQCPCTGIMSVVSALAWNTFLKVSMLPGHFGWLDNTMSSFLKNSLFLQTILQILRHLLFHTKWKRKFPYLTISSIPLCLIQYSMILCAPNYSILCLLNEI